jgi:hypothetical protein
MHEAHVSKCRLMYAYERLHTKDLAKAELMLAKFEKACSHTSYIGEIVGERELMELVGKI